MTSGQEPTVWARPPLPPGAGYGGFPSPPPGPAGWGPPPQAEYGWRTPAPLAPIPLHAPRTAPGLPPGPFVGPGQPGPAASWFPPGTPQRSTARWWLLGAVGVLLVAALVVTIVVTVGGGTENQSSPRSAAATEPPPVPKPVAPLPVAALAGLLPGPSEFAAAAGTGPRAEFHSSDRLYNDRIVDQDCVGAVGVGNDEFFEGSGWVAARTESLVPPGDNTDRERGSWLAVVSYSDAAGASAMYQKLVATSKKCAGRSVNLRDRTDPADYDRFSLVGQPTEADGVMVISRTQEGGEGWGCQNGTTARNNVVITAGVCGDSVSPEVVRTLVQSMAAKVSTQT